MWNKNTVLYIVIILFLAINNNAFSQNSPRVSQLLQTIKTHNQLELTQKISLFVEGIDSLKKAKNEGELALNFYSEFASFLYTTGAYKQAIHYHQKILQIAIKQKEKNKGNFYYFYSNIANCFFQLGKLDSGFSYYDKAILSAKNISDNFIIASGLNNYGIQFLAKNEFIQSLSFFNDALLNYRLSKKIDSNFYLSICDNIANSYLGLKQFDSAANYFQIILQHSSSSKLYFRNTQSNLGLAHVQLEMNNSKSANEYLKKALFSFSKIQNHKRHDEFWLKYHKLLQQYYWQTGNIIEAKKLNIAIFKLEEQQKISKQKKLDETLESLMDLNILKLSGEIDIKDKEIATEKLTRNFIIILSLIAIILGVVFWSWRKKLHNRTLAYKNSIIELEQSKSQIAQMEIEKKEFESAKMKQTLEIQRQNLLDSNIKTQIEKNIRDNIILELKQLLLHPADLQKKLRSFLVTQQNLQSKNIQVTDAEAQLANIEFNEKIKLQFPKLNESDIELCTLIKIKMSNKEIASIKKIEVESVKMAKNRLIKKMKLNSMEDLLELFEKVI